MAKRKTIKTSKAERFLYQMLILITLVLVVGTVFGQASLSKVNLEVEKLKMELTKQEDTNESLVMKINEMASLENIQTIAEDMGLAYNNDNIKIILK